MGARHSTRQEWSFDSRVGAGDATSVTGKLTHRSSSGKLRTRLSKVARSHSDRTPATLSTNRVNYGEICGTKNVQDYSPVNSNSSVSTACQTQIELVSIMTQTEPMERLEIVTDDVCCPVESDLPTNDDDVGNGSSFDFGRKSHDEVLTVTELHCARREKLRHDRLTEAESLSSDKENCSSVVCNRNHVRKHNSSADSTVTLRKHLSCETDQLCSAIENISSDEKKVQELGCIINTPSQATKTPSVDSDIKQLSKRKQSDSSDNRLVVREYEWNGRVDMSHIDHHGNAFDCGLSFGSLNSEDMMYDMEVDETTWSSNATSRHASADSGSLSFCHRLNSHSMGTKCTAISECSDYLGHQSNHNGSLLIPQVGHSTNRKCDMHNDGIDSTKHSESSVIGEDINNAINGWIGLDLVSELSPTESDFSIRYVSLNVCLKLSQESCLCIVR